MFDDLRQITARQRTQRTLRRMNAGCKRLLGENGELGGMAIAADVIDSLDTLEDSALDGFFDFLANDLSPDPQRVLQLALDYANQPGAKTLLQLTRAAEPARQELFRRLNRTPGGTAAVLRLDEALAHYNAQLPRLKEFILPGGTRSAALAHVSRTVARRAERAVVALAAAETVNEPPRQYLNRLSDLMFVLARVLNRANLDGLGGDDVYWQSERLARSAD